MYFEFWFLADWLLGKPVMGVLLSYKVLPCTSGWTGIFSLFSGYWIESAILSPLVSSAAHEGFRLLWEISVCYWNMELVGNSAVHMSWNRALQCPSIPTRNTKQRQCCQTRNWVTSLCKQEMCAILSTRAGRQHSVYETSYQIMH